MVLLSMICFVLSLSQRLRDWRIGLFSYAFPLTDATLCSLALPGAKHAFLHLVSVFGGLRLHLSSPISPLPLSNSRAYSRVADNL